MGLICLCVIALLLMLAVMDIGEYKDKREQWEDIELSEISIGRGKMAKQDELENAVKTWLDYEDSDRYDEDKTIELINARIVIRESLRNGAILLDTKGFNTESATECYTAVNKALRR